MYVSHSFFKLSSRLHRWQMEACLLYSLSSTLVPLQNFYGFPIQKNKVEESNSPRDSHHTYMGCSSDGSSSFLRNEVEPQKIQFWTFLRYVSSNKNEEIMIMPYVSWRLLETIVLLFLPFAYLSFFLPYNLTKLLLNLFFSFARL